MGMESYLLRPLDRVRAKTLTYTLRLPPLRAIFNSRYLRSVCLILLSFAINVFLMLHFPLWTLLLVPGFLGMPHLIESLRSFHKTASPEALQNDGPTIGRVNSILFASCGIFGVFRILSISETVPGLYTLSKVVQENFRIIDLSIVLGSFFLFLQAYGISIWHRSKSLLAIVGVGCLMHIWPGSIWGIFIFSHNFMAFRYWHFYAPSREEKRLCLATLMLFICIHILVLSGLMNAVLSATPVDQGITKLFGYSFSQVALDVFPGLHDLDLSRKIVMLLCFGQGIHYVLWIKVIPECRLSLQRPIPFRMYFRRFKQEWGEQKATLSICLLILFFLLAFLIRWDFLNNIFFALAFYHIYAEYLAFAIKGKALPTCPS